MSGRVWHPAAGATRAELAVLHGVDVRIADLGGQPLGTADASAHTITLEADAAGWGGFVDPTTVITSPRPAR